MKSIGNRILRGLLFGIMLCVLVPTALIILGLLSSCLGTAMLADWAFRFYYVYALVPSSFLAYPDISPKLGIPATAFGIGCVLLFWSVMGLIVGLIHALLHRRETMERTSAFRLLACRSGRRAPEA